MGSIDPNAVHRATEALPTIPRDIQGPVFREPWDAHAFALALTLQDTGLFAWTEWAAMLSEEIKTAQGAGEPVTGTTYYRHWMATLERMVAEKGLATAETLTRYERAWDRAAHRTPHGMPIELRPEDFSVCV